MVVRRQRSLILKYMSDASVPERRPRRETAKARATRESLIELAARMFADQGYSDTSIRDISQAGSVTSGAIYGHFRNKAELLAAAISSRTALDLEARSPLAGEEADYIETLTRLALEYAHRRQMRTLIVQGAAAALTDDETRTQLREEQLSHLRVWLKQYEEHRNRMGIDANIDMETALLYTWAVELGLGVLECLGIEPRSARSWSEVQNRLARGLQLPPDDQKRRRPRNSAPRGG